MPQAVAADPDMTIGGLLDALRTGPYFRDYYILPLSGAIWSTPPQGIMAFPGAGVDPIFPEPCA